ncbi:MAG: phosphodiester glycosidase family protein [Myxococcales bacterium]|nr:phosphodiester glycosidase family protein [Myxococcales bacterium]
MLSLAACVEPPPPSLAVEESALLQAMPADAIAAPGDYDGDGCTDLGVKGSNGIWYLDLCANGFGGAWDAAYASYGNNTSIPVPADYDGDGRTDLSVKDATGMWGVDYAVNGFGVYDVQVFGYGGAGAVPVPADYDGDGKADLAVKDSNGMWAVDLAITGFAGWDDTHPQYNYGGATSIAVPGNYSGNGRCSVTTAQACSLSSQCPAGQRCFLKADLAIKTTAGDWFIDTSSNGVGAPCVGVGCTRPQWDLHVSGYGNAAAVPVPADYDHDGYTDLSIKDGSGTWYIDRAGIDNSGNPCASKPCVGGWNVILSNLYGGATTAMPGDYTPGDGRLDLDLAVKDNVSGHWYLDKVANGYGAWDSPTPLSNVTRPAVQDPNAPHISATTLQDPHGTVLSQINGRYLLTIGMRYTVTVTIAPGSGLFQDVLLEVNPAKHLPSFFNLEHPNPPSEGAVPGVTRRRFSVTCSQPGTGLLGFQMVDVGPPPENVRTVFNRDPLGVVASCVAPPGHPTGLHGVVTARGCSKATCGTGINGLCGTTPSTDGHYIAGCRLQGATITVAGVGSTTSAADGSWSLPAATGGPRTVTVTCASASCFSPSCPGVAGPRSTAVAVNVTIPTGSAIQVDASLEERFFSPTAAHAYTTYIDYARGRTVIHVVAVTMASSSVRALRSPSAPTLVTLSNATAVPVVMNGGYFDQKPNSGNPVGYYYSSSSALGCTGYGTVGTCRIPTPSTDTGVPCYVDAESVDGVRPKPPKPRRVAPVPGECPEPQFCSSNSGAEVLSVDTLPMLAIKGATFGSQIASIINTDGLFWTSSQFTKIGTPACPLYDLNRDGLSDVNYAIQAADGPLLVQNGVPMLSFDPGEPPWARTAIGVGPSGSSVYFVVADGEGVNGGHGATWFQMANFFGQVLGATSAMKLDGGLSSELVLRGSLFGGARHVNTLTGEDHTWDVDPFADPPGIVESANCSGSVANYLTAGQ